MDRRWSVLFFCVLWSALCISSSLAWSDPAEPVSDPCPTIDCGPPIGRIPQTVCDNATTDEANCFDDCFMLPPWQRMDCQRACKDKCLAAACLACCPMEPQCLTINCGGTVGEISETRCRNATMEEAYCAQDCWALEEEEWFDCQVQCKNICLNRTCAPCCPLEPHSCPLVDCCPTNGMISETRCLNASTTESVCFEACGELSADQQFDCQMACKDKCLNTTCDKCCPNKPGSCPLVSCGDGTSIAESKCHNATIAQDNCFEYCLENKAANEQQSCTAACHSRCLEETDGCGPCCPLNSFHCPTVTCEDGTIIPETQCRMAQEAEALCFNACFELSADEQEECTRNCTDVCVMASCEKCCKLEPFHCPTIDCGPNGNITETECLEAARAEAACFDACDMESAEDQQACQESCRSTCLARACEHCCPLIPSHCPVIDCGNGTIISETLCHNQTLQQAACFNDCAKLQADEQLECTWRCTAQCEERSCSVCCPLVPTNCPVVQCTGGNNVTESECTDAMEAEARCFNLCFNEPADKQEACTENCKAICMMLNCPECCPLEPFHCPTVDCGMNGNITETKCLNASLEEANCFNGCSMLSADEQQACEEECKARCINETCSVCCVANPTHCPVIDCGDGVILSESECHNATLAEDRCFNECFTKPAHEQRNCTEKCHRDCLVISCAACCPLEPTNCPTFDCGEPVGIIPESWCLEAALYEAQCFNGCLGLSAEMQEACESECYSTCVNRTCPACCPLTPNPCPTTVCSNGTTISTDKCHDATVTEALCFDACFLKPAEKQLECTQNCLECCLDEACDVCCPLTPTHCPVVECNGRNISESTCHNATLKEAECFNECLTRPAHQQLNCTMQCHDECELATCGTCCPLVPTSCPVTNCSDGATIPESQCHNATLEQELCFNACFELDTPLQKACTEVCIQDCLEQSCDVCCLLEPLNPSVVHCGGWVGDISETRCLAALQAEANCFNLCSFEEADEQMDCEENCRETCLNATCAQCCPMNPNHCPVIDCGDGEAIPESQCHNATIAEDLCFNDCFLKSANEQFNCTSECHQICLNASCGPCCPLKPTACPVVNCSNGNTVSESDCHNATVTEDLCFNECFKKDPTEQFDCMQMCHQECLGCMMDCSECCPLNPYQPPLVRCDVNRTYSEGWCLQAGQQEATCFSLCDMKAADEQLDCKEDCRDVCLASACPQCCPLVPSNCPVITCSNGTTIPETQCHNATLAEEECFNGCMRLPAHKQLECTNNCSEQCVMDSCDVCCRLDCFNCPVVHCEFGDIPETQCRNATEQEALCFNDCMTRSADEQYNCTVDCQMNCLQAACNACCPLVPTHAPVIQCPDGSDISETTCRNASEKQITCFNDCLDLSAEFQEACTWGCIETCLNESCEPCCKLESFHCPVVDCGANGVISESYCRNATDTEANCFNKCAMESAEDQQACEEDCKAACLNTTCAECCPMNPNHCPVVDCGNGVFVAESDCRNATIDEALCFNECLKKPANQQLNCTNKCHQDCLSCLDCEACCPLVPTECPVVNCSTGIALSESTCRNATEQEALCFNMCFNKQADEQEVCTEMCKATCLAESCPECCPLEPFHCPTVDCGEPNGNITETACLNAAIAEADCFDQCATLSAELQEDCELMCKETCLNATCALCCPSNPNHCPVVDCGPNGVISESECRNQTIQEAECFNECFKLSAEEQFECTQCCHDECLNKTCDACCPLVPTQCPVIDCGPNGNISESTCLNATLEEEACFNECLQNQDVTEHENCTTQCHNNCLNRTCEHCCQLSPVCPDLVDCRPTNGWISEGKCLAASHEEADCFNVCQGAPADEQEQCEQNCRDACLNVTCDACCRMNPSHCPVIDCGNNETIPESQCHNASLAQELCFNDCFLKSADEQLNCTLSCHQWCIHESCAPCCLLTPTNCPVVECSTGIVVPESACRNATEQEALCFNECHRQPADKQRECSECCKDECLQLNCPECCPHELFNCPVIDCGANGNISESKCLNASLTEADCFDYCATLSAELQKDCEDNCKATCLNETCERCCPGNPAHCPVVDCGNGTIISESQCHNASMAEDDCFNKCLMKPADKQLECTMACHLDCVSASCEVCCKLIPTECPVVNCSTGIIVSESACRNATEQEALCFNACLNEAADQQEWCTENCRDACLALNCPECCPLEPFHCPTIDCAANGNISETKCLNSTIKEAACFDTCVNMTVAEKYDCEWNCITECLNETCETCCPLTPSNNPVVNCGDGTVHPEEACLNATIKEAVCFNDCLMLSAAEQLSCTQCCHDECLNETNSCLACCPLVPTHCPTIDCGEPNGVISETSCLNATLTEELCFNDCFENYAVTEQQNCTERCHASCLSSTCEHCCKLQPVCPTVVDCGWPNGPISETDCLNATRTESACFDRCAGVMADEQQVCEELCKSECLNSTCAECCPLNPNHCPVVDCQNGDWISTDLCHNATLAQDVCFNACFLRPADQQESCMTACHATCMELTTSCAPCCPLTPFHCPTVTCPDGRIISETMCREAGDALAICFNDCLCLSADMQENCTQGCLNNCTAAACEPCCLLNPFHCPTVDCGWPNGILSESECRNATVTEADCFDYCATLSADEQEQCELDCKQACLNSTCAECCPLNPNHCPVVTCPDGKVLSETECHNATLDQDRCFNLCFDESAENQEACTTACHEACVAVSCDVCCPLVTFHCPMIDCGPPVGNISDKECLESVQMQRACYDACMGCELKDRRECQENCSTDCLSRTCAHCCPLTPDECPVVDCGNNNTISIEQCHNATLYESTCFDECFCVSAELQYNCTTNCHETCLQISSECSACCPLVPTNCPVIGCPDGSIIPQETCLNATLEYQQCHKDCGSLPLAEVSACRKDCKASCVESSCDTCCPDLRITVNCTAPSGTPLASTTCDAAQADQAACFDECFCLPITQQYQCMQNCTDVCLNNTCEICCLLHPFEPPTVSCSDGQVLSETQCLEAARNESLCFDYCFTVAADEQENCTKACHEQCINSACEECCLLNVTHCPVVQCDNQTFSESYCRNKTNEQATCFSACFERPIGEQASCRLSCTEQCQNDSCSVCCPLTIAVYECGNRTVAGTDCGQAAFEEHECFNACLAGPIEDVFNCTTMCFETCNNSFCELCCPVPPYQPPTVDCENGDFLLEHTCFNATIAQDLCFNECLTKSAEEQLNCTTLCHDVCMMITSECGPCCPLTPTSCPLVQCADGKNVSSSTCANATVTLLECKNHCFETLSIEEVAECVENCNFDCFNVSCDSCCPPSSASYRPCGPNGSILVPVCYTFMKLEEECFNACFQRPIVEQNDCMNQCHQGCLNGSCERCCLLQPFQPPVVDCGAGHIIPEGQCLNATIKSEVCFQDCLAGPADQQYNCTLACQRECEWESCPACCPLAPFNCPVVTCEDGTILSENMCRNATIQYQDCFVNCSTLPPNQRSSCTDDCQQQCLNQTCDVCCPKLQWTMECPPRGTIGVSDCTAATRAEDECFNQCFTRPIAEQEACTQSCHDACADTTCELCCPLLPYHPPTVECTNGTRILEHACFMATQDEDSCFNACFLLSADEQENCTIQCHDECIAASCDTCCPLKPTACPVIDCDGKPVSESACRNATVFQVDCFIACGLVPIPEQSACVENCTLQCKSMANCEECCPMKMWLMNCSSNGNGMIMVPTCKAATIDEDLCFNKCFEGPVTNQSQCTQDCHDACINSTCEPCCPLLPYHPPSVSCTDGKSVLEHDCLLATLKEEDCFDACLQRPAHEQQSCTELCKWNCINESCDSCCLLEPTHCPVVNCNGTEIPESDCFQSAKDEASCVASCTGQTPGQQTLCQAACKAACMTRTPCSECCPYRAWEVDCGDGTSVTETDCNQATLDQDQCYNNCFELDEIYQEACTKGCHTNCTEVACESCCPLKPLTPPVIDCGMPNGIISQAACKQAVADQGACFQRCLRYPSRQLECQRDCTSNCTSQACEQCCPLVPDEDFIDCGVNGPFTHSACDAVALKLEQAFTNCTALYAGNVDALYLCQYRNMLVCLNGSCSACCRSMMTELPLAKCSQVSNQAILQSTCDISALYESKCFCECRANPGSGLQNCQNSCKQTCISYTCAACCPNVVSGACPEKGTSDLTCKTANTNLNSCILDCEKNSVYSTNITICKYNCSRTCQNSTCAYCCPASSCVSPTVACSSSTSTAACYNAYSTYLACLKAGTSSSTCKSRCMVTPGLAGNCVYECCGTAPSAG